VGGEEYVELRDKSRQPADRAFAGRDIRLRDVQVDWIWVEGVADEQNPVLPVKQAEGIGCVFGRQQHFEGTPAEIYGLSFADVALDPRKQTAGSPTVHIQSPGGPTPSRSPGRGPSPGSCPENSPL
jgi:hypothetical protein